MAEISNEAYQILVLFAIAMSAFTFATVLVVCSLTTHIIKNYRAIYEIQSERVDHLAKAVTLLNQQLSFLTVHLEDEVDDGK